MNAKNIYTFGSLELTFSGLGVPFLSERAEQMIAEMSLEAAKRANRDAWKQRRIACGIANRHNNMSIAGNSSTYDHATQHYRVAELVCKATYRRMQSSMEAA